MLTILVFFVLCFNLSVGVKPWEPQQGSADWLKTHYRLLNMTKENQNVTEVVFIGASITHHWQTEGKDIWNTYYVNRSAYNYGVSGDTTSNVLWRIQNQELDGLNPKLFVLQIGYNNMNTSPPPTGEEISRGILEIIKELRTKFPFSKLIDIGITPLNNTKLRTEGNDINNILKKNVDQKSVYFMDIGPDMIDTNGNQKAGLFVDGLHFTLEGYKIWHKTMQPLFEKLLLESEFS